MIAFWNMFTIMYFVVLLESSESESSSVGRFVDSDDSSASVLILPKVRSPQAIRSEGVFKTFLRNFFDVLSTSFPERKLTKYCRVLSQEVGSMEHKYARSLADRVRRLCRTYGDDLIHEMTKYRGELDESLPRRTEFLDAMNDVFTVRENQLFDDYIYDLRNYGTGYKPYIHEETRKLLIDVIVGAVLKRSRSNQKELSTKLRRAIKEYLNQR